CARSGDLDYW
nr:immunoglobulin heavy chain junction region [Mus musculus]